MKEVPPYLIQEALEQLRCAEINCDNVERFGLRMAAVVKMQVQLAIKALGGTVRAVDVEAATKSKEAVRE